MELDFSILDQISGNEEAKGSGSGREETPDPKLERITAGIAQEREQIAGAYKTYQNNIKQAGLTVSEIRKGVITGEDIYSLFLKAMDAIGKMTGDRSLYDQIRSQILSIYGVGLRERQPLEMELSEIQARIAKLEAARSGADPERAEILERAIRENKRRAEEISQVKTA